MLNSNTGFPKSMVYGTTFQHPMNLASILSPNHSSTPTAMLQLPMPLLLRSHGNGWRLRLIPEERAADTLYSDGLRSPGFQSKGSPEKKIYILCNDRCIYVLGKSRELGQWEIKPSIYTMSICCCLVNVQSELATAPWFKKSGEGL